MNRKENKTNLMRRRLSLQKSNTFRLLNKPDGVSEKDYQIMLVQRRKERLDLELRDKKKFCVQRSQMIKEKNFQRRFDAMVSTLKQKKVTRLITIVKTSRLFKRAYRNFKQRKAKSDFQFQSFVSAVIICLQWKKCLPRYGELERRYRFYVVKHINVASAAVHDVSVLRAREKLVGFMRLKMKKDQLKLLMNLLYKRIVNVQR